jgi:hypothetical protein
MKGAFKFVKNKAASTAEVAKKKTLEAQHKVYTIRRLEYISFPGCIFKFAK